MKKNIIFSIFLIFVLSACIQSSNTDISSGLNRTEVQEAITLANIDVCQNDSDCIVVPNEGGCACEGAKRAINKNNLKLFEKHPEWSGIHGEICSVISPCTKKIGIEVEFETICTRAYAGKRCQLIQND